MTAGEPTRTGEAYRRLEEMIVTLELAPGSVVSEAILGRQLGIGTTPVREALQRLAREFLVQILPRRGVVVTPIDVTLQLQVLEVRREIDRLIARRAAERARESERREMTALAGEIEAVTQSGDLRAFMRIDRRFNDLVMAAARNDAAANSVAPLHAVSRRFWFYHRNETGDVGLSAEKHLAIMQEIATGDGDGAAAASDALLDYLTEFARATID